MTVKMTQRDKKLLSFLAVFIVVMFLGTFAILPLLDESGNLNSQMAMAQAQKVEMESKLALKDIYIENLEKLKTEWNDVTALLNPTMSSSELDSLMTEMIQSSNLTAMNETITFVDSKILEPYFAAEPYTPEEADNKVEDDLAPSARAMEAFSAAEILVTVEGSTENIQAFVDLISEKQPGILLNQIEYTSVQDNTVRAKIQLLVYMCEKEVE